MKKSIVILLAFALLAACPLPSAFAAPEDWKGRTLPDFSAKTISGDTFTLSESLRTHDLVLINLWATWCGPCRNEFPYLEAAWEQYGSRVDVIALSVETSDTFDVLRRFANEYGLKFAVGRDETNIFGMIGGTGIPTTLIVDRDMRIVAVEVGSKSSVNEFTSLFDRLLSAYPDKTRNTDRCVLYFRDTDGNPVKGVTVAFCNGEYDPIETDENGRVSFDCDPDDYHVHLLGVPDGYKLPWEQMHVFGDSFELTVTLHTD